MAKRQTRRSISVAGITYQRLKNFCAGKGYSVSGYLEVLIGESMDRAGEPVPERIEPRAPAPQPIEEIISQHFTW